MSGLVVLVLASLAGVAQQPPSAATPDATRATAPLLRAPSGTQSPAAESSSTPPEALTQDQIKELIRQAAEKDIENEKKQRDYTYVQRQEGHKLDGKGQIKSKEIKTFEVMILYGEHVERMVAKDDKPLSEKDTAKEEEKIQKILEKGRNENDERRKKRLEKEEKDRQEGREFVREVSEAYNFRLAGIEELGGRDAYVIDADPRPGFAPHQKYAKVLPKFRFRVWIDKAETQWVKLDAQCIDTVSFGLFLARIHKGSRVLIETARVNDEVWLPQHVALKVDVRLALLKNFNVEEDVTYRDYKKFRSDTKIVGVGEIQDPK
jgi:hypothetical protein